MQAFIAQCWDHLRQEVTDPAQLRCTTPLCEACQVAKARRKPTGATKTTPVPEVVDGLRLREAEAETTFQQAKALHDAEETRDKAIHYLQHREAELTNQLAQTEAELKAAMDGLRNARHEAEDLRAYIDHIDRE